MQTKKKIPILLILLITLGTCLFLARSVIVNKLEVTQIENKSRHLARMAALPDVPDPNVIESVINMLAAVNIDANDNDISITSVNVGKHPAVNRTITIRTDKVDIMPDSMFPKPQHPDQRPCIEKNDIWDKIDYWQLLPENHPRRLWLLMSD
jgi:hypothetical protein